MNNTPNQPNQPPTAASRPARPVRRPTRSAAQTPAAPAVNRPAAQTPAAPAVNRPAAQTPAAPAVNRPVAQTPAAPAVNRPAAQTPAAPAVNRPAAQTPAAPAANRPAAQTPAAPAVSRPAAQTPSAPAVSRPAARTPSAPAVSRPAARTPSAPAMSRPTAAPPAAQQAETTEMNIPSHITMADDSATRKMPLVGQQAKMPAEKRTPSDMRAEQSKKKKQLSEGAATLISIVKAITYIVLVIVLGGFLSYYVIQVANDMFAFVKSDEQVTIEIPENATIYNISEILAENKIIVYPDVFELYAKLNKDNGEFVAGTYEINAMMNYDELLMAFKEKYTRGIVRLTIPEGYTVDEIIDLCIENGVGMVVLGEGASRTVVPATREDFIAAVNNLELYDDFEFVRALIGNTSANRFYALEGYLFPDTYEFYTDSSPAQIFYKLLNRFNNLFKEEFYTRAAELGYTVDEMIILASMIEKETRLYYEFEQVSSVFHNRLKLPGTYPYLESDATIMYAIQHDTGARKEEMTQADWGYVSPYNTYTNQGLPPGPIANPSYQAITCALYPEQTDYYFFISDTRTGQTIFSRTYAEHEAAKAEIAARAE